MSNVIFQPPAGLSWSIRKRPRYGTIVQDTTSGRGQIRMAKQQYPVWEYEMNWNYLTGAEQAALGANSGLEQMMGFFMARQGRFDDFLYSDPNDNSVTAMPFGAGDGTTAAFQLQRTIGGGVDIVQNVNQSVSAPKIYKYDWQGKKNVLVQSENLSLSPWVNISNIMGAPVVTANAGFAPDGSNNATKFVFANPDGNGTHYSGWGQACALPFGGQVGSRTFTFSIWLKADANYPAGSGFQLILEASPSFSATFVNPSITTQWQRFAVSFTFPGGNTDTMIDCQLRLPGTGSAAPALYAWGAQIEESASATAYQKTGANSWGPTLQYSAPRTNRFSWSQAVDNAVWTKVGSGGPPAPTITADAVVAPDGTTTADSVSYPSTAAGQFSDLFQAVSGIGGPGTSWTFSIWLKAASNTTIDLILADSGPYTGNGLVETVVNVSAKWQRFILSTSFTAGASNGIACSIRNIQNSSARTIHIWGAQLESGLSVTTYIQTTSAAVTTTDCTLGPTGIVTFANPPVNNALLTWDGSYYYRLHFAEDGNDFEEFMYQLWELRSVKLESVIL